MRTIKFRGKKTINGSGQWVSGNYIHCELNDYILPVHDNTVKSQVSYSVLPETVGQFTGLLDKRGKEIFEGDIVKTGTDKLMEIGWREKFASFVIERDGWVYSHYFGEAFYSEDCEVIGNIHDNPELIANTDTNAHVQPK